MLFISFIFKPAFPLGRVVGGNSPRRTWNISWSTVISDSSNDSTPRWDQAMSEMQSLHLGLGQPLGRFAVDLASKTCLASLSCGILHGRTNVAVVSQLGQVVWHSGLCKFHSCALCREVSHQGRNEDGKGGTCLGRRFTRGRQKVPKMSQVFLQYGAITPKRPRVEHGGAKLFSFPGRHLTSVACARCHTVKSSQKFHLWRLHLS